MTRSSQREKFNFLHVLEGGKGKQEAAPESSKSQSPSRQPVRKSTSTSKRKSTQKNKAVHKNRPGSKRRGRFKNALLVTVKSVAIGLGRALYYGTKAILVGPVRLVKNSKARLRTALPYLIIIGFIAGGALLAYGSHLLVERRSTQSIARLLEIKSLIHAGKLETAPSRIFENPWSWNNIRVQRGNGEDVAIVMEGISEVGCKNVIDATLTRFPAVTVNGLQVDQRQDIRRFCSSSVNTLAFLIEH